MLRKYPAEKPTPMFLYLPEACSEVLQCEQVLRVVPGKRASYLGHWGDREVFVKLFFNKRRAWRHWERERRGIETLTQRGLATPALLYAGPLAHSRGYVLVTQALSPAETLAEAWQRAAAHSDRIALLKQIGEALAAQHRAGILQHDPHLGNFLLSGGQLYSIDASKLGVRGQALPDDDALANLALVLAQLEPQHDANAQAVLRAYTRVRGQGAGEAELSRLQALIDHARDRRKRLFLKKIFRECTAYAARRAHTQRLVHDKHYATPGFARLYENPETVFSAERARFLKRGNTATLVATRIDGVAVVIKRYNVKSFWHGIRRTLKRTRASISWENAHLLRFYGVPTPAPIAMVERRIGPIRRTSYFVSEYVEGQNCRDYFASKDISDREKACMAEKITDMLSTLARHRLRHGDLKATNLIVSDGRVYLVDLDAVRAYRSYRTFRRGFQQDVERLRRNWADQPEVWRFFEQALIARRARSEKPIPRSASTR